LKEKRARIIIADVYGEVARQVMCEAYKLEMTAVQVIITSLCARYLRMNYKNIIKDNSAISTI